MVSCFASLGNHWLKEESTEIQKILFTGLDTAGKTSIILALQREFSKIANIEPSRGAQRRIFKYLGRNIAEWDLEKKIISDNQKENILKIFPKGSIKYEILKHYLTEDGAQKEFVNRIGVSDSYIRRIHREIRKDPQLRMKLKKS